MTGLPPFELGAYHVSPTVPDDVNAGLFAKDKGALASEAALIETSLEKAL